MSEFITAADRERAQALLREGEALLWVGKPVPTGLSGVSRLYVIAAAAFVAFSCVLFCLFGRELPPVGLVMLGVFLLPELVLCIALPPVKYRQMSRWLYVLTDRRAIALRHDGVQAWPLAPGMVRDYKPGARGSIIFSYRKSVFHRNRPWLLEEGFLRCREAEAAMAILEQQLAGGARPPMASPEACAHMERVYRDTQAKQLAASPGLLAAQLLFTALLTTGGIFSLLWWWADLPIPLIIFITLIVLVAILIQAAQLRAYLYGKKLLGHPRATSCTMDCDLARKAQEKNAAG